jgi:hypothetical protein
VECNTRRVAHLSECFDRLRKELGQPADLPRGLNGVMDILEENDKF